MSFFEQGTPVITPKGAISFNDDMIDSQGNKSITLVRRTKVILLSESIVNAFTPKDLHQLVKNPVTSGLVGGALVVGVVGYTSSLMNIGCFNPGVGFIKFFQIIETLGRLLFIPIVFNSDLHDVLYGINELGEFVNLDHDVIIKTPVAELKDQHRYWYKMSIYREWKNIWQAMPLSMVILLFIALSRVLIAIITKIKPNKS